MEPVTGMYGLGAAYLIVEVMKFLINRFAKASSLTSEESFWLQELHAMHGVKDASGRPIWYMPAGVGKQQEKIIDILKDVSHSQEETAKILERIVQKLND